MSGGLAVAALVVGASAVTGGAAAEQANACGTVTLNEQAWAGSTANTYVVKNVLEKRLGCKVNITKIAEVPVYQAMADGKTDAILEDWGHSPQWDQYVTKQKTVVRAGANGVTGVIGWYIPTYLMKQHPEFKTWKGLKGEESLFKSPESGSQGMFLGGDPRISRRIKTLIKALGLNLKFVSVGAEPAQVARWTQLYKQRKPVLFYWYDPQYLNASYKLSQIQLPAALQGLPGRREAGGQPEEVRLRISELHAAEVHEQEVRDERLARRRRREALQLVERRPERRRRDDRRGSREPRQGGADVDRGQQGQGQQVAR